MKVTLLIPTLKEIEGMRKIMPQINPSWVDQILVVDGHSQDGTEEYCKEHGYEFLLQEGKGLKKAYFTALSHIKGDVVITFSPDGNSDAARIPELVEKMKEGHDMVIVSRYLDWAKSDDDDVITGFGNWLFTKTVNVLFGSNYTDVMVMYRAFKTDVISKLKLDKEESYSLVEKIFFTDISWEPLLSARAAHEKMKIAEIPGDEPSRIGGVRKLQIIRWGAAYYTQFLMEFFRKVKA